MRRCVGALLKIVEMLIRTKCVFWTNKYARQDANVKVTVPRFVIRLFDCSIVSWLMKPD